MAIPIREIGHHENRAVGEIKLRAVGAGQCRTGLAEIHTGTAIYRVGPKHRRHAKQRRQIETEVRRRRAMC